MREFVHFFRGVVRSLSISHTHTQSLSFWQTNTPNNDTEKKCLFSKWTEKKHTQNRYLWKKTRTNTHIQRKCDNLENKTKKMSVDQQKKEIGEWKKKRNIICTQLRKRQKQNECEEKAKMVQDHSHSNGTLYGQNKTTRKNARAIRRQRRRYTGKSSLLPETYYSIPVCCLSFAWAKRICA